MPTLSGATVSMSRGAAERADGRPPPMILPSVVRSGMTPNRLGPTPADAEAGDTSSKMDRAALVQRSRRPPETWLRRYDAHIVATG
jgi:hypothetical protein